MSLTMVPMGVLLLLQERGLLSDVDGACDFGSMEFDSRSAEINPLFEALFRVRGRDVPPEFYDAETGRLYGAAGDFFRALGWSYVSYDIDGRFGSTVVDLNVDPIPESEREKYALTMNIGTSEHVFNQHNFFVQFHDATRVGGLMLHVVPFFNYHNHGLYSYSPAFFFSLAQYNGYEVLGSWQCHKPHYEAYRASSVKPVGNRVPLISLLRRTRPGEFVFPLQVNEPMLLSPQAEARYGAFTPKHIDAFGASGALPQEFYLDIPTATTHDGPIPKHLIAVDKAKAKAKEKEKALAKQQAATPPRAPKRRFGLLRRLPAGSR